MNQAERPPINLRRPSKHEKAVLLQNYAAKRRSSVRPAMTGTRRNTTGALTVNGSSARRLRTASVAVGLEATARPDGGAPLEAASEPSLSCFGALCSVIRAATDYCRYGNLRQYLLIDPESGEPKHIYSAGRLETQRSTSESKTSALNGSEYILPPEIRAEIVAAAKRGKLQQYLQLRKHSLQLQASRSLSSGDTSITPFSPCKAELLSSTAFSTAANVLQATQTRQGLTGSPGSTMHAAVVSRNIQQQRAKHGSLPQGGPPGQGGPYGYMRPPPALKYGRPPPFARGHVKHIKVKGKKGKKTKKETYDLIVNINLKEWQLTHEQVVEYKEVFMLFDKDEDGVLSFPELAVVMKSLGQRPSEDELLKMVQEVSEDPVYHTIEFNEFLQLLSKQQRSGTTRDSLTDAFSIFDKDDDGYIPVQEMRQILQSLGDKMTDQELDEMMETADSDHDGFINYEDFVTLLCGKRSSPPPLSSNEVPREKKRKEKKPHKKKEVKESNRNEENDIVATTQNLAQMRIVEELEDNGNISNPNQVPMTTKNHNGNHQNGRNGDLSIVIIEEHHHHGQNRQVPI